MADEPDIIVLKYLRRIDAKVGGLSDDIRVAKLRLTNLEEAFVGMPRRFDRPELGVERIERRLDLVEAPLP